MRVTSLHVYPVKGMRAVDLERSRVATRGLEGDRCWLVVDAAGKFLTQRSHPAMATMTAKIAGSGLVLSAPGLPAFEVEVPAGDRRMDVTVWSDLINAAVAADGANRWVSEALGGDLRLVHLDARAERKKIGEWVPRPVPVSFADAYPVLVATTGSLSGLNAEIGRTGGAPVPMQRFRPNIVIECDDPWQEDFWGSIRIGAVELDLVKPSDRCIVTTTDQETGQRMGKEPLASLARIRRSADPRINGVLFAWNAVPRILGEIAVGDTVEVLSRRPEGFPLRSGASSASAETEALVTSLLWSD